MRATGVRYCDDYNVVCVSRRCRCANGIAAYYTLCIYAANLAVGLTILKAVNIHGK